VTRRRPRLGLRGRLIIALVGVALLSPDLVALYSNLTLNAHLRTAAHERLSQSATHFTAAAQVIYGESGRWTPGAVSTLTHVAELDGLRLTLRSSAGSLLATPARGLPTPEPGSEHSGVVRAGGRLVGRFTLAPLDGHLLTQAEQQLGHQLNQAHLIAGGIAAAVGVVVALYLALTLSRPLLDMRRVAQRMRSGNLEARLKLSGDAEMRAVEEALNSLAETLQREEELRKTNLADLAHEVRTPLMGILARIEAAQDGVLADESANLAALHDEALRLARLLDDLSALAEAERPGLLLKKERVDLGEVAGLQARAMRALFEKKGVALEEQVERACVDGDPKRLRQVVANLLSNALAYTEPDGRVELRVHPGGGDAVLEVADTGIGIAAADLPHLFARFWRGEKSRSRATGGAGIGLAIVQELVRAHEGRIEVDSELGKGSRFRVRLPLDIAAEQTETRLAAPP
jgi:signal transduction histidine kinase